MCRQVMERTIRIIAVSVVLLLSSTVLAQESVIDNKDSGGDKYFSILSGYWRTNNGGANRWDPADPTANYRWQYARSGAENARAMALHQPAALFEDRVLAEKAASMTDKFDPLEVHIYQWK